MVKINIKKPLYNDFCYIRDVFIRKAVANDGKMEVTIPQGRFVIKVDDFMKNARKMEKIFLRPDKPMILWGNHVMPPTEWIRHKEAESEVEQLELI